MQQTTQSTAADYWGQEPDPRLLGSICAWCSRLLHLLREEEASLRPLVLAPGQM